MLNYSKIWITDKSEIHVYENFPVDYQSWSMVVYRAPCARCFFLGRLWWWVQWLVVSESGDSSCLGTEGTRGRRLHDLSSNRRRVEFVRKEREVAQHFPGPLRQGASAQEALREIRHGANHPRASICHTARGHEKGAGTQHVGVQRPIGASAPYHIY